MGWEEGDEGGEVNIWGEGSDTEESFHFFRDRVLCVGSKNESSSSFTLGF